MSGTGNDFVGRAIDVVKRAIERDKAEEYTTAYQLYCQALELFMLAIKWEKNERSRETLRAKTSEYMERAEKLKAHLDQVNKQKSTGYANGNNLTSSSHTGDLDDTPSGGMKATATTTTNSNADGEAKKLRGALASAILRDKPQVSWNDVAGLDQAKEALKEAVILPIKFPHLFTGQRKPWKGILLYGPPGTGKSYLAKAVATEAQSTFFSVSSSDLVSKWMGESERLVKQLFTMAREQKPSIIFIDEIDALCGPRGEGESEASRRIKTELLVQMDGVGRDTTGVLVLGATNIPWQLDAAIRRRFQRRVHIGLPDRSARRKMFELSIGNTPNELLSTDFARLADLSEGFSGSDISSAVQDALMQPIRRIQTATHYRLVLDTPVPKFTPCSPGDAGAVEMSWSDIGVDELVEPALTVRDFERAIRVMRPSVSSDDLERSAAWTREFGSEGA